MKKIFNHYYKFKVNSPEQKVFDLICKTGCYKTLEERSKRITKFVNIQMKNVYCVHPSVGQLQLINPFYGEIVGLTQLDESSDVVIIIYNFYKLTVELFISEDTRKSNMVILQLVTEGELNDEMSLMRKQASAQLINQPQLN